MGLNGKGLRTLAPRVQAQGNRLPTLVPGSWRHDGMTAPERGYDWKWRRAREVYLREHPLCRRCEGENLVTPATVVDHIQPHRGDMTLFWQESNWQPMCKPCHDAKTAREDGGFGNELK
jgi:5-methylcytosine-specific restriction protein A